MSHFSRKFSFAVTSVKKVTTRMIQRLNFRLEYLAPLMVYFAFGASALTSVVGTFWVKDYLNLSPAALAGVFFWATVPWIVKIPIAHLVDLFWRWRFGFLLLGAIMLAASFWIMLGLIGKDSWFHQTWSIESWFILAMLLAPAGYVLQDIVADAMTIDVVPSLDAAGNRRKDDEIRGEHVKVQTLGRASSLLGGLIVGVLNFATFGETELGSEAARLETYQLIFKIALFIPLISISGALLSSVVMRRSRVSVDISDGGVRPNWPIIAGGLLYISFALMVGGVEYIFSGTSTDNLVGRFVNTIANHREGVLFLGSVGIVGLLLLKIFRRIESSQRSTFIAAALVIFVTGIVPLPGDGVIWWQIDVLKFDQRFQSLLALASTATALGVVMLCSKHLAQHSVLWIAAAAGCVSALLMLPYIAMCWGFHDWLSQATGGVLNARAIAILNVAGSSPLQQLVTIPALAWIANSAPRDLKATFFAVTATLANVASSGSRVGSKYLNEILLVERGEYQNVGNLLIAVTVIGLVLPLLAILAAKLYRTRGL